ncbi:DUF2721 domain-containing protein [Reyranella sp.]|uniref:DUF2721 domain-containing protein n=1 Tax=Reyranella sp. TaxID=1929291 RepID=UPI003D0CBC74
MPNFETLLPLLISIASLLAMISIRNTDVATRARNCRSELLYQVDKLDANARDRRKANLKKQIQHFQWRYRLMSAAFIVLVFAASGVGLYATATLDVLIGAANNKAILYASLCLFVLGMLATIIEMWVGPTSLDLNSQD